MHRAKTSRQTLTARWGCGICQMDIFSRLVVTIHLQFIAPGQDGLVVRRPHPRRLSGHFCVSLNRAGAGPFKAKSPGPEDGWTGARAHPGACQAPSSVLQAAPAGVASQTPGKLVFVRPAGLHVRTLVEEIVCVPLLANPARLSAR